MWNLLSYTELASARVDFTNELSWFVTGLAAVVFLSVMMLALTALAGRVDERLLHKAVEEEVSYREAA